MRRYSLILLICLSIPALSGLGCAESTPEPDTAATSSDAATETASADTDSAATASNTMCPIMGEAVTDDGGTAEWNGTTVRFCCPGCIEKWEALSDDEKKAKLAEASDSANAEKQG